MKHKAVFSSEDHTWETPDEFYKTLHSEFRFTLDPCATGETAKCDKYFTVQQNGLAKNWAGETVFCNPPYSRELHRWVEKCYHESRKPNTTVVMLIPSRTDTKWFHSFIYGVAEIRFIKGRLKFQGAKHSAPFPSMIVVYRGEQI